MSEHGLEHVILVDGNDTPVGTAEKLAAHTEPRLHRAFSVFVRDVEGNLLLQRRARAKYHSGGLWSNTCCSHPRPGESTMAAALRRLDEEMGFRCGLRTAFSFVYRAELEGGLVEHEYDHVFLARWSGTPTPDPAEVEAWRWACPAEVKRDLAADPGRYTFWFRVAFDELVARGFI